MSRVAHSRVKEPVLVGYPLNRDRLDVKEKTRRNFFNWRGQFTPEFVEYVLGQFAEASDVVLDPFCGSGTVLQESARRNLLCYGYEINPAAYAMSRFFSLANLGLQWRRALADALDDKLATLLPGYDGFPLTTGAQDFRGRFHNLLDFARVLLNATENRDERLLALLLLFSAENSRPGNLPKVVRTAFADLRQKLCDLPQTGHQIQARLADARSCDQQLRSRVSLILTSPPYINVFNYHQNHRAILELLGFDMLRVAQSELGSNRKNRGNRFRTVVQFCLDMEQVLAALAKCLIPGGLIVLVVGRESRVRGVPFLNSAIVHDLLGSLGCFSEIRGAERSFVNRFGSTIKEDLLIGRRECDAPSPGHGVEIALKHLRVGLLTASPEARGDISEAISDATQIGPSPLFSLKGNC